MAVYLSISLGSWLVTRLSLKNAYRLGAVLGILGYVLSATARRNIQGNLAVVFGRQTRDVIVRWTALRAFMNNGQNWIDSLRLEKTTAAELESRVRLDHWDVVETATSEGKGVIVLGMHLGNVDLVGQLIAARGYQVTIPVEVVKPEALFRKMQRLRQRFGIHAIDASRSGRQLLRSLKAEHITAIMVDRNLSTSGVRVRLFGRETTVSKGAAWLVSKSDAPVLIGTGIRRRDGSFDVAVLRLPVRRTGNLQADEHANAQIIMNASEALIRQHPNQWAMFAPVWEWGESS